MRANRYRFLGPVGPDVKTALCQMTEADKYTAEIVATARNVQDVVRQFNDDLNGFWVIDLQTDPMKLFGQDWEALPKEQRGAAQKDLNAQLGVIKTEIKARVLKVITDNLLVSSSLTTEQIKTGLDKSVQLKDLVESAEKVSAPDQ